MALGQRIRLMDQREDENAGNERRRFGWRLEYTLLLFVALLTTAFALVFFYFSADISQLKTYGYAGLFVINLVGAASIMMPSPAAASVFGGGALLDGFLGLSAFLFVALFAR